MAKTKGEMHHTTRYLDSSTCGHRRSFWQHHEQGRVCKIRICGFLCSRIFCPSYELTMPALQVNYSHPMLGAQKKPVPWRLLNTAVLARV